MARKPNAARVTCGILWSPDWFFAHEGPFSRLAKIAKVNAMSSQDVNRQIFGVKDCSSAGAFVHGRSLIDMRWITLSLSAGANVDMVKLIRTSSWSTGAWEQNSMQIASDMHLRYCPTCLKHAFQSALMQIVALKACPVHGDALLDKCQNCGAPCPRYAVEREAFQDPMRCARCENYYSDAWSPGGLVDSWRGIENCFEFGVVETWLTRVGGLKIPSTGDSGLSEFSKNGQRRAVFDFLRNYLRLDISALGRKSVVSQPGFRTMMPRRPGFFNLCDERVSIYKAIRRHFERRLKIKELYRKECRATDLRMNFDGPMLSLKGAAPPALHGFLLWRARFDRTTNIPPSPYASRRSAAYDPKMMLWPDNPKWAQWHRGYRVMDSATWGTFVLYCLQTDIANAHIWASMVSKVGKEFSGDMREFLVKRWSLADWMERNLCPDRGEPSRGIGIVEHGDWLILFAATNSEILTGSD